MDFTNLREHYHELLDYLRKEKYTQSYIRRIKENIGWMLKNEKCKQWQSYIDYSSDVEPLIFSNRSTYIQRGSTLP